MGWAAQRRVLSVPFEESRTRPGSWKGDWSPESAHVSNNTFNFNLQAFKNSHIHEQLRQCTTQLASNLHLLPCTRKWCGRRPPGRQHEETRKVMEVAGVDGHTLSRCLLGLLSRLLSPLSSLAINPGCRGGCATCTLSLPLVADHWFHVPTSGEF